MKDFADRLKVAIGRNSVNSIAKKCDISESLIRNYLKGAMPGLDKANSLANALGVNFSWLATGEGSPEGVSDFTYDDGRHPLIYVPLINIRASAGDGALVTEEKATALLAFHKEYLRGTWSIHTSNLFCMEVSGESMMPTINHGELLICSHDAMHIHPSDGVFIVRFDGNIMVKRLQFLPGKKLKVSSDNTLYDPFEIALNDGVDFAILGKVLLINGVRRI